MKKKPAQAQASHVTPVVAGGAAAPGTGIELVSRDRSRRSGQLRVLTALHEPVFEARPGLPAGGREECREGERPCPYVRCKHHLWLVLASDRRGRRRDALESTVEPFSSTTCALDVAAARREHSAADVGSLLGISPRRVQQIVKTALEKLRSAGATVEALR